MSKQEEEKLRSGRVRTARWIKREYKAKTVWLLLGFFFTMISSGGMPVTMFGYWPESVYVSYEAGWQESQGRCLIHKDVCEVDKPFDEFIAALSRLYGQSISPQHREILRQYIKDRTIAPNAVVLSKENIKTRGSASGFICLFSLLVFLCVYALLIFFRASYFAVRRYPDMNRNPAQTGTERRFTAFPATALSSFMSFVIIIPWFVFGHLTAVQYVMGCVTAMLLIYAINIIANRLAYELNLVIGLLVFASAVGMAIFIMIALSYCAAGMALPHLFYFLGNHHHGYSLEISVLLMRLLAISLCVVVILVNLGRRKRGTGENHDWLRELRETSQMEVAVVIGAFMAIFIPLFLCSGIFLTAPDFLPLHSFSWFRFCISSTLVGFLIVAPLFACRWNKKLRKSRFCVGKQPDFPDEP